MIYLNGLELKVIRKVIISLLVDVDNHNTTKARPSPSGRISTSRREDMPGRKAIRPLIYKNHIRPQGLQWESIVFVLSWFRF